MPAALKTDAATCQTPMSIPHAAVRMFTVRHRQYRKRTTAATESSRSACRSEALPVIRAYGPHWRKMVTHGTAWDTMKTRRYVRTSGRPLPVLKSEAGRSGPSAMKKSAIRSALRATPVTSQ